MSLALLARFKVVATDWIPPSADPGRYRPGVRWLLRRAAGRLACSIWVKGGTSISRFGPWRHLQARAKLRPARRSTSAALLVGSATALAAESPARRAPVVVARRQRGNVRRSRATGAPFVAGTVELAESSDSTARPSCKITRGRRDVHDRRSPKRLVLNALRPAPPHAHPARPALKRTPGSLSSRPLSSGTSRRSSRSLRSSDAPVSGALAASLLRASSKDSNQRRH